MELVLVSGRFKFTACHLALLDKGRKRRLHLKVGCVSERWRWLICLLILVYDLVSCRYSSVVQTPYTHGSTKVDVNR